MICDITKEYMNKFIKGEVDTFGCYIEEFDDVMKIIDSHGIVVESESDSPVDVYIHRKGGK